MKYKVVGVFLMAALAFPSAALSQSEIPQPVIDQCNADLNAGNLPGCLKTNAVAFKMLEAVQSADFYSASAKPVIDGCLKENKDYLDAWLCFESAASKAVETRALIGVENIADKCVVGISDPEVFDRIQPVFDNEINSMHLDKVTFVSFFHRFSGCPSQ